MSDPGVPPSASLFDALRLQALVFEELRRIQTLVLAQRPPPAPGPGAAPPPEPTPEATAQLALLRRLQGLLLEHPVAAQAAFSALLAEGRRFAATPEGAVWKRVLADSDWVRNGRLLWDVVSLNLLEETPSGALPSAYLEALFRAAETPDLEGLMRSLLGGAHGAP
jgi:hypothetical protein